MAKSHYFIVAVTNTEKTKRFAYIIRETGHNNMAFLIDYLVDSKGNRKGWLEWLSPCESKAHALDCADAWNTTWSARNELWNEAPLYYTWVNSR